MKTFLLKKNKLSFIPAIAWLIISSILLTLPGSSFPTEDWLSKIWFDKWVHIGMFVLLVFLWCRAIIKAERKELRKAFIYIAFAALLYGIGMEFVQKYVIPNRSFDTGDIVADAVGCIIGFLFSWRRYIKKLTPVETGVATKTNCL